ncbi:MAG: hypothetical protein QXO15_10395 [Nitrososphaerota archaeon]
MVIHINPFVEQRKQLKLMLLDMIKRYGELDAERIIALFSLKTGLKRETIKEYWKELEEAGVIENGRLVVDYGKHKRGIEAAERLNKQRVRDDGTSEDIRKENNRNESETSEVKS